MPASNPMFIVPPTVAAPRGALWAAAIAVSVVEGLRWVRRHAHVVTAPSAPSTRAHG
ncbi:hypothetical protein [Ideonella sp. A 288]|uniref:hypothetical protein n=1 Tax=Ideonella sp. A 288 TaxID=1962181 RepID=UPI001303C3D9|nr:hypothetical protein [Ideonella sp. A 288]